MRYNKIGINIDNIDKLILDIYDYAEKINKTLNQISSVVDQTKLFYKCDVAADYRNKFLNFKTNFNVINKNVKSYADDLIKLKNKYKLVDENVTKSVLRATKKMQNQLK